MGRVRFRSEPLREAMAEWPTKTRLAQEMQSRYPNKYKNTETPARALRRAENGEFVDIATARCIACTLNRELSALVEAEAPTDELAPPSAASRESHADSPVTRDTRRSPGQARWRRWIIGAMSGSAVVAAGALLALKGFGIQAEQGGRRGDVLPRDPAENVFHLGLSIGAELGATAQATLVEALRSKATPSFDFTVVQPAGDLPLLDQVNMIGADGIVDIRAQKHGRHVALRLYLASARTVERLWSEAAPGNELEAALSAFAARTLDLLAASLLMREREIAPVGTADGAAFDAYLSARLLMEGSGGGSAVDLAAANNSLQSALLQDPGFALAHAAHCEVLTRLYWIDDRRPYLREAEAACRRAQRSLPDHPYVLAVAGLRDTRDGDPSQTIDRLQLAIESNTDNVGLRLALADASFARWQRESEAQALDRAIQELGVAVELEPAFWLPHFWLGTYLYYADRMTESLVSLERAAELNPVELTLANLGTVSLCQGDLETARYSFGKIEQEFPANHLGPEMRAKVHQFLGEFDAEVKAREKALRVFGATQEPQIHQIFGALADSYQRVGRTEEALSAYRQALQILDRDEIQQTLGSSDHTARAYYLLKVDQIRGGDAAGPAIARALRRAAAGELDVTGEIWAAQIAGLRGDPAQAEYHWREATASCPIYAQHPDNRFASSVPQNKVAAQ